MDKTHIADQLLAAGTALAGLVLVFLSNALARFEAYQTEAQDAVRNRYLFRGYLGFIAFILAAYSAAISVGFYWKPHRWMIYSGEITFVCSVIISSFTAFISVKDIH